MPATITDLPTPVFTFDPDAPGACVAGVRPFRDGSYRLEKKTVSGRVIVHNYGHGGSGITLSWGCAAKVKELVRSQVATSHDTNVAVLGAGVMGLTAATLLLDLGLTVTIYTDRLPAATTSHKAGGQWSVSIFAYTTAQIPELKDILKTSYSIFKGSIGHDFGVSELPNYTQMPAENFELIMRLVPGLLPPRVFLSRLPFAHHMQAGYKYQTLLVEPPLFLARLETDLRARGVTFVQQNFGTINDVFTSVTEKIIVNCTGLGAKTLWNDSQVMPIRGQLAMLPPQPALQYLYSQNGYMFPRKDHVVIGGTYEENVDSETPVKADCQQIVQHMASLFGQATPTPLPLIHIQHPRNARMVDPASPEMLLPVDSPQRQTVMEA